MVNKLKCQNCGRTIVDNLEKHRNRDKICPGCGEIYKRSGIHLSININWLREKLHAIERRKEDKLTAYRGKAKHKLELEFIQEGKSTLPTKEEIDKRAREMFEEDKSANKAQNLKQTGR